MKRKKFNPESPRQQMAVLILCLIIGGYVGMKLMIIENMTIMVGEKEMSHQILGMIKEILLIPFFLRIAAEVKVSTSGKGKSRAAIKMQRYAVVAALVSFLLPAVGLSYLLYKMVYVYPIAGIVSAPTDIILALACAQSMKNYIPKPLIEFLLLAAVIDDVLAAMATPLLGGHYSHIFGIILALGVSGFLMWLLRNIKVERRKVLVLILILAGLTAHISPLLSAVVLVMCSFSKEEAHNIYENDQILKILSFFGIGAFALVSIDTHGLALSSLLSTESSIALASGIVAVLGFYSILAFVKNNIYGNQLKRLSVACFAGICMTMSLYFIEHFNTNILSSLQINSLRVGVLATSTLFALLGLLFALMSGKIQDEKINTL